MSEHTSPYPRLTANGSGSGVVSQAGAVLLLRTAEMTGLTNELSQALASWRKPAATHDPGKIVLDLAVAVAVAAGGDCLADIGMLRIEPAVFGTVASDPTVSRTPPESSPPTSTFPAAATDAPALDAAGTGHLRWRPSSNTLAYRSVMRNTCFVQSALIASCREVTERQFVSHPRGDRRVEVPHRSMTSRDSGNDATRVWTLGSVGFLCGDARRRGAAMSVMAGYPPSLRSAVYPTAPRSGRTAFATSATKETNPFQARIQRIDMLRGLYTECDQVPLTSTNDVMFDDTGMFLLQHSGSHPERSG